MADDIKDRKVPSSDLHNFADEKTEDNMENPHAGQESLTTASAEQSNQEAAEDKNTTLQQKAREVSYTQQKVKALPQIGSVEDTSTDTISGDTLGGMETKRST